MMVIAVVYMYSMYASSCTNVTINKDGIRSSALTAKIKKADLDGTLHTAYVN